MQHIRGKSIVIFKSGEKFLFTAACEPTTGKIFYCPVGGGIEFGEYANEAAKREVLEEMGEEIINIQLLDVRENIFTYDGKKGHEIVFVFKADFKNVETYHKEMQGYESNGAPLTLLWSSLDEIREKAVPVYPDSIINLLESELNK
jgi:ADP-ribose pyrophosphatase YjhB (NUDIX family)